MEIQVDVNGVRKTVTSTELFQLAATGQIFPQTRLWVDGKETTCDNVSGIRFKSNAGAAAYGNSAYGNSGANNTYANNTNAQNALPIVHTPFLDYKIGGGSTPYVICYLDAGRTVFSSNGGRVWMKGAIETQTSAQGGFLKSLGRWASGESIFMSIYKANGPSEIAFATKMPGCIVARQLAAGESLVCQKGAFLAATSGVDIKIFFQKRVGAALFGGEGFVMQQITGPGVVFLELDGAAYEYDLQAGEKVTCDTGALAWADATCSIDIVTVKGLKNMLLGGEGVFDTVITGPGKATFQSMSLSSTAGVLAPIVARMIPHN